MRFTNARRILNGNVGLDAGKLLLLAAKLSRPRLRGVCSALLKPFVHDGEISIRYKTYGRWYKVFIRASDEASDTYSVMELASQEVYPLDPYYAPDRVVDGGGNIGLFTLEAAAAFPLAKIVTCEPMPRNIKQIEKHLRVNGIAAEIKPVCIGGSAGAIPFYGREANQSSFDATKPYTSRTQIAVMTLKDIVGEQFTRIFIKLDIEGMEIETLDAYVPGETRAVSIAGELHGHKANKHHLERIFSAHGWKLTFEDESDQGSLFFAQSPAAIAFIDSHKVAAQSSTV